MITMRFILSTAFLLLFYSNSIGQTIGTKWYSETTNNGILIQNSFPKGGPYTAPVKGIYHPSYLVFYTRLVNTSDKTVELSLNFAADSFPIPNSPHIYVKLFLPSDTMTADKRDAFSYGITALESFKQPTMFQRNISPQEECLFYVVSFFYQTNSDAWNQERGGNRAELSLKGQELFYSLPPQIEALPCGSINFK